MRKPKASLQTDSRLAAVLNSIGDVYYVLDRDWRIVLYNAATQQFFRMAGVDLHGRQIWDVAPGSRDSPFAEVLTRAMNEGVAGRIVARSVLRPDRVVELRASALGDEGIGVTLVDVTDLMHASEAERISRERLDLAVGAHAIGIFDWHVPSGAATWSAEMEAIFGLKPGTFEGHTDHFRRRVVPEDLARIEAETAASVAAGHEVVRYEFRIIRDDGEIRWIEGAARHMSGPDGQVVRIVGTNIDITERKQAEEHQRLLVHELNHRVKNTLAIVQAIAWQSFRAGAMVGAERETFEGRLAALANAHDVLTQRNWEAGSIDQMIAGALAPHDPGDGRLSVEGPIANLRPKTAVALALAMHELATNAVKYGAFSTPAGRVEVRWTIEAGRLRLTWREIGGPPIVRPTRRGFGLRLLEHGLAEELKGRVDLDFRPEGLACTVEAELEA